jgi:capsular exopolysaccharide synthesis family protein
VNSNLVVPNEGAWEVRTYESGDDRRSGQRNYAATNILDFATLSRILFHWRWLILAVTGLGLMLALLVTLMTQPKYRAWVTLQANPPTFHVTDDTDGGQEDYSGGNTYDFVATQVGLLQSRSVAERAAQELNLANNPDIVPQKAAVSDRLDAATTVVAKNLDVISPEEGQLIKFSFESTSPQLAASVANAVADGFINSAIQRRYESSAYARNFLERQINKTRADLERSERGLVAYAQQQGIINTSDPNGQQSGGDTNSLQGESLMSLNQALAAATAKRVAAEGAYRQALATGPTAEVTESTQPLQQQLATLRADYQQKRTFMKPDHPDMISLRSQIDELQRQIGQQASRVSAGRSNSLLADYRAALSAERALQARVNQLKGAVLDLRGRSIKYNILQREVDTNRTLYDGLLQRYKEIGVAGGVGVAPVSIVDRADAPDTPFRPNLILNLALGLGLGLLAGVGGAIGFEFINDTIKSREDVRRKLALPCLGTVPRSPKGTFLEELNNPSSAVSEAYSAIVAALRFSTEAGIPKALLLTSTHSREGKSSSALALAQNNARRGSRVLLIDGDMRKPAFKAATDKVGLSKLLTTDDRIDDHVVETQYANLWLLPSGPIPPSPADLLSSGRIRKVIAEASDRFDLVIIDGPPTLGLADAPLLAAATGEIVFVIESGKTRTRQAIEALNRLEATGTHILGAVLEKATEGVTRTYGSYGHYGYGADRDQISRKREIPMLPNAGADGEPSSSATPQS